MDKQEADLMGAVVEHAEGGDSGTVIDIRQHVSNGRRYVFLQTTGAGVAGPFPADEVKVIWP